jgi:3-oxoacyl-[acyl-carrier-protein] synthase-3
MARLLGLGHALPARRIDNDTLSERLGRPAAEIARSGVESRFYAEPGQGPSELARVAAADALAEARLEAKEIEFLIFATMTPDVTFPGSGCYLQDKLGCDTVGALDLRAHCAGFLFALDVADQFIRAGAYRRVLVAAGDVHGSGLDFSSSGAEVTPLFGDGAAVAVLGDGEGIVGSVLHTDATHFERFWCEFPSSRRIPTRFLPEDLSKKLHFPRIDAEAVRRDGERRITDGVREVLDKTGTSPGAVRRYFLQHVFRDAALAAAAGLGVGERATVGGRDEGHIASASLPLALSRARRAGEVGPGDLVCLATAGAGENWGAMLLQL